MTTGQRTLLILVFLLAAGRAILPNVTSFATSPFNFTFNPNDELLNAAQSNGKCVAWFAFDDPVARAPYTVTFDFDFRARSNPTTWRPADQVLAALGVSAVSGASASAPPTATVTVTAAPEATAVGTSSSLSAGAAAGIGVAVTAIVMGMALALVGWRLWKARRHTEAVELSRGSGAGATIAAAAPPVYMKHQSRPSELNARSPAMMEDNRVRQFELNG